MNENNQSEKKAIELQPQINETPFFNQNVVDISVASSIIGLILSVYVTFSIYIIKNKYARKGRLPEIITQIANENEQLTLYLNSSKEKINYNYTEATTVISKIRPFVLNIKKYSTKETKQLEKETIVLIDNFLNNNHLHGEAQDKLWKIHTKLLQIIITIDSQLKDDSWN